MRPTAENTWTMLKKICEDAHKKDSNVCFDANCFELFYTRFKYWHALIKNFMDSSVTELDRHKIAAILTISIIESHSITYNNLPENTVFIGAELYALTCGFSYMQDQLNNILRSKGQTEIEKYVLPEPFYCSTKYLDVMARNLYYAETKVDDDGTKLWGLNPLELANTFYLIEYITLLSNNVPVGVLIE